MTRLSKEKRLELGRRYAEKEITLDDAVKEYGVHKSTVWAAVKDWKSVPRIGGQDVHDLLQKGFGVVEKAAPDKVEATGPTRPPVDHAYVDRLEAENEHLHDEVRTLQKLLMVVGRTL